MLLKLYDLAVHLNAVVVCVLYLEGTRICMCACVSLYQHVTRAEQISGVGYTSLPQFPHFVLRPSLHSSKSSFLPPCV